MVRVEEILENPTGQTEKLQEEWQCAGKKKNEDKSEGTSIVSTTGCVHTLPLGISVDCLFMWSLADLSDQAVQRTRAWFLCLKTLVVPGLFLFQRCWTTQTDAENMKSSLHVRGFILSLLHFANPTEDWFAGLRFTLFAMYIQEPDANKTQTDLICNLQPSAWTDTHDVLCSWGTDGLNLNSNVKGNTKLKWNSLNTW